jgi:hypothetical protein
MATYNLAAGEFGVHDKTLVASTVDTVNWPAGVNAPYVEVLNDGGTDIFVTVNGATPTVAGNNTFEVPPGAVRVLKTPSEVATAVKLISAGTPTYSVTLGAK